MTNYQVIWQQVPKRSKCLDWGIPWNSKTTGWNIREALTRWTVIYGEFMISFTTWKTLPRSILVGDSGSTWQKVPISPRHLRSPTCLKMREAMPSSKSTLFEIAMNRGPPHSHLTTMGSTRAWRKGSGQSCRQLEQVQIIECSSYKIPWQSFITSCLLVRPGINPWYCPSWLASLWAWQLAALIIFSTRYVILEKFNWSYRNLPGVLFLRGIIGGGFISTCRFLEAPNGEYPMPSAIICTPTHFKVQFMTFRIHTTRKQIILTDNQFQITRSLHFTRT